MVIELKKLKTVPSGATVKVQAVTISGNGMLTLKHTALYLGISQNTLRGWINYESVPFDYYKVGGRVMFKKSDLDEYTNRQLVPAKMT